MSVGKSADQRGPRLHDWHVNKNQKAKDYSAHAHGGHICRSAALPATFTGFNQDTDSCFVSTVGGNTVYLFIMGLIPILIAARRLKAICREK